MKEVEIVGLRKEREKHFLTDNGEMIAKVYSNPIHFKKGNKYEEIDNTLVKENNYYKNKNNDYIVQFMENTNNLLMKMIKDNYFLEIKLDNQNSINGKFLDKKVIYNEILPNIDLEYLVLSTKVKENIILKNNNINKISFLIKTNLELVVNNKEIDAKLDSKTIFTFEPMFMLDNKQDINRNIYYNLNKRELGYQLDLILDEKWLETASYPVIIDPIITNTTQEGKVYDTYIYPGDTGVDKNSQNILKAGVERVENVDTVNRALVKFDLPTIGTGSQVIKSYLNLYGYGDGPALDSDIEWNVVDIHRVTQEWSESSANWSSMNDKFDSKLENYVHACRSHWIIETVNPITYEIVALRNIEVEITDLVKKWYSGTPNYGIMIKAHNEEYENELYPAFFSNVTESLAPTLIIHYRNQNGLESYMNYISQGYSIGSTNINTYNGNLVGQFGLGQTIGEKNTIGLSLIYNTNDIILESDYKLGKGYKFNYHQIIELPKEGEVTGEINYLKYTDEDGTIHYFQEEVDENYNGTGNYIDEDGLNLSIIKMENSYIMTDKYGNQLSFNIIHDIGYLSTITNTENKVIQVIYDNNNRIVKVIDPNNLEINITYNDTSIIVTSADETVTLNYEDSKLVNITNLLGQTIFSYNANDLIEYITDVNGLKTKYEYYGEIPYRIKKVSEYSINDNLGQYFDMVYSYNTTTIKDNKNRIQTLNFNNSGNLISKSSLVNSTNLKDAYSIANRYFDTPSEEINNPYKNKVIESYMPIKYVNNLLTNTSFEENTINFISEGNELVLSTEYVRNGLNSLKAISSFYQEVNVEKGKYYTFSAYIKNNQDITLSLSYDDVVKEEFIKISDGFSRSDITIFYPSDAISSLKIRFILSDNTIIYVDDIQLEEGEIVNNYNMISNSDFSLGYSEWTTSAGEYSKLGPAGPSGADDEVYTELDNKDCFSIVSINDNGDKALKISMSPTRNSKISKTFPIKGKKNDVYEVSFWYKNEGIIGIDLYDSTQNSVNVYFKFTEDSDMGTGIFMPDKINSKCEEWQYYRYVFFAMEDYDSITLEFNQALNFNDMYITNICMFKDPREIDYDYDENGNLKLISNLSNKISDFKYDINNQLIKMTDPQGKNFKYEYDNLKPERILNGISETGINNTIKYDSFGNPIVTKIVNKITNEITNGLYRIRCKGTNDYLKNINKAIVFDDEECNHDLWQFSLLDNGYYTINHNIINNNYFVATSNQIILGLNNSNNSLFKLIEQENGSYYFMVYEDEIFEETDDDENNNVEDSDEILITTIPSKYIKRENDILVVSELIEQDPTFEFYIEGIEDLSIETNAKYTETRKFINSIIVSNLNEIIYNYDEEKGLLNSIITPLKEKISYIYDDKKRVIKVVQGNKIINYNYNLNNQISKIMDGDRNYSFIYDEFLNIKEIKIGDNITLVTNVYEENNGNLVSSTYGNDNIIHYTYDDFDRIKSIVKSNNTYRYNYDNQGNLVKLESNDNIIKYIYDLSQKLSEYRYNNFKVKYVYDSSDNVVGRDYSLDDIQNSISNILNKEYAIEQTNFDDKYINYSYDVLGRKKEKNINNLFKTSYNYLTNGNRTSMLINSVNNNGDIYKYKYDKVSNITHIYHNEILETEYSYDKYNRLIEEKNYIDNEITRYTYDNYGNILNRKVLDLINYNVKSNFNCEYNNSNWKDQLTKFNNITFTYDNAGNPLTIGNDVLTWINGRQLNSYNNITYKYNHSGIRTGKIINGVEINYYLEGTKIIFEKSDNDVICYIYDDVDGLIGFKYNNDVYYYVKNIQKDIIGILDINCNLIVNYRYDSWGNILSITDSNGNDITDSNHIGIINPFRYRSYYYDTETNLYYLNSRYYSPILGRFLNADGILGANRNIMSYNLYAYCDNDPIVMVDTEGYGILFVLAVGIIGGIASGGAKVVSNKLQGRKWNEGLHSAFIGGFVTTSFSVIPSTAIFSGILGSIAESGSEEVEQYISGEKSFNKFDLLDSVGNISKDIVIDYSTDSLIDKVEMPGKTKINPQWGQPQSTKTIKTSNYTKKIIRNERADFVLNAGTNYYLDQPNRNKDNKVSSSCYWWDTFNVVNGNVAIGASVGAGLLFML